MQGQFPRSVQANVFTYEMQAQVAHSVQIKSPTYFAPEVNHGRFPSSVQTNTPTHVPFSGGAREQQVHFTPQPNQLRNHFIFSLLRVLCQRKVCESMN